MGFRDHRLMPLVPRYATVAIRSGVTFGGGNQLAPHLGWYLEECASTGVTENAAADAARCESGLHVVAFRINAFDAKLADTRRAACVGFFTRGLFAISPRQPHFVAPKIDLTSQQALGPMMDGQGGKSDCLTPRKGQANKVIWGAPRE